MRLYLSSVLIVLATLAVCYGDEPSSFRRDVAPILLEHCVACHNAKKAEGGYRIDTFDELSKPGDSGETPIKPPLQPLVKNEEAQASDLNVGELLRRIVSMDPSERMPSDGDPLSETQIVAIRSWLATGATFDGERSNELLALVVPPAVYASPPEHYLAAVPVTALVFSPDGSQLLVGGYHEVTVWDVNTKQLIRRIQNVGQRTFSMVFLPDHRTLAVGCGEPGVSGEVRLIDFETATVKGVVGRTNDVVLDLAMKPGSNELAIASADGLIRILNVDTLEVIRTISSHADWVTTIAWSDDGTRLVSGSRDKSSKVFDTSTGNLLATYPGHGAAVRGVCFVADGKQVISTGSDQKLHRWEVEGAKNLAIVGMGGEAFKIARGDSFVLVPSADGHVRRVELSNNAISQTQASSQDWALTVCIHSATNRSASGAINGEVRVWNTTDGTPLHAWVAKP